MLSDSVAHVLYYHVKIAFLLIFYVFGYCFRTLAVILALDLLVPFQLGSFYCVNERLPCPNNRSPSWFTQRVTHIKATLSNKTKVDRVQFQSNTNVNDIYNMRDWTIICQSRSH